MSMRACRSYFLALEPDDFRQVASGLVKCDPMAVVYLVPANENTPVKVRLSARIRVWLSRQIGWAACSLKLG